MPCIFELAKYLRKNNFVVGKKDKFQSWTTSCNGLWKWPILSHFGSKEVILVILYLGKNWYELIFFFHLLKYICDSLIHSVPNNFVLMSPIKLHNSDGAQKESYL